MQGTTSQVCSTPFTRFFVVVANGGLPRFLLPVEMQHSL